MPPASSRSRLMVFTRHTPLPTEDGAGSYLFDILAYLNQNGMRIEVVWLKPHDHLICRGWFVVSKEIANVFNLYLPGQISFGRLRLFPHIFYLPWKARLLHRCKQIFTGLGLFSKIQSWRHQNTSSRGRMEPEFSRDIAANWIALASPAEISIARQRFHKIQPDVVMANYCWLNEVFDQLPGGSIKRVSLTHDVAHQRSASLSLPGGFDWKEESRLLEMADLIVSISHSDAETFRDMLPQKEVLVVPKAAEPRRLSGALVPGRCLFVGSHNPPNQEGLFWFLESVWPLVRAKHPAAHLQVCGSIGELFTKPYEEVSFLGRVDELEPAYAAAELVIVPLLNGSGVKIKLVEACSFGKACVTTSTGLQGLSFLHDCVLCADEPEAFAVSIGRILMDAELRERLGEVCLHAAQIYLSREESYAPLFDWLTTQTSQSKAPTSERHQDPLKSRVRIGQTKKAVHPREKSTPQTGEQHQ